MVVELAKFGPPWHNCQSISPSVIGHWSRLIDQSIIGLTIRQIPRSICREDVFGANIAVSLRNQSYLSQLLHQDWSTGNSRSLTERFPVILKNFHKSDRRFAILTEFSPFLQTSRHFDGVLAVLTDFSLSWQTVVTDQMSMNVCRKYGIVWTAQNQNRTFSTLKIEEIQLNENFITLRRIIVKY